MGVYINTGIAGFESLRNDNYVDKSMLIAHVNSLINTEQRFICVSRMRRCGKSVSAYMLESYYMETVDSRTLFDDLQIAQDPSYATHRNRYPTIFLDLTGFLPMTKGRPRMVEAISPSLIRNLQDEYPDVNLYGETDLLLALYKVTKHTGKQFIMFVDEWDMFIREHYTMPGLVDEYFDLLRHLFCSSESKDIFALVYMTGIMPIKKFDNQSGLPNFIESTMLNPGTLAPFFSFSADEVRTLCQSNNLDYATMCNWFDGYQFGNLTHRFNPVAVVKTIWHEKFRPYWSQTGSWHTIEDYVSMPYEGLKDATLQLVAGESIPVDVTTCQNDMHVVRSKDEALTTLILLGYLSYDCNTHTCRIPNQDVASAFGIVTRVLKWVKEY